MRIYEANGTEKSEGMRLGQYVAQAMPLLPVHVVRDAFDRRDVKIDGRRAGRDEIVHAGCSVRLYTNFEAALPVVFEDENILLVNKPAGVTCDQDEWGGMTVLSLTAERAKGAYQPRLCHRLDNQTCGLLLLCKNDESERLLLDAFRDRKMEKIYECLARGEMRPPAETKTAFLIKDTKKAAVRIVTHETPGALPIATKYETMDFDGTLSRLRVTLLTGRTHQIRAHLAFLSHPILGDDKYGDRALNRRLKTTGLKLCATELTFFAGGALSYLDGRTFRITAPF